tara:strand:+ start:263 stop:1780 length:1518 start_codon:yes stop_codon:yes gene_type:complete
MATKELSDLEKEFPGWSNSEIIQGYKDEDAHLYNEETGELLETEKKMKNLEKYEDIESSDKNLPDTRYIDSHPDNWKKKAVDHGFVYDDEGNKNWGSLNEEGKFISFDEEVEDDNDEIVVDEKIEIDGGNALNDKIILPKKKPDDGKKKTGLAKFTEAIGSAFENIATELPKKIDEVWSDKKKRRNVLRGLEIINASSGIKPLGQAKSPLGMISEGLLKAEGKFTAEDIEWYKAKNPEKKILSAKEKGITDVFKIHAEDFEKARNDYRAVDIRFNELYKLALAGKDPPTGILESAFSGLEKVLSEIGLLDEANALLNRNQETTEFSDEDLVKFKDIFTAATKRQIVGQVKELYPVSNKDIEILLQTVGDISTNPKALRALVAAEKAAKEINTIAFDLSGDIAFAGDGNFNFKAESQDAAAAKLAAKYKEKVKPETLIALYGKADNPTDFQIVNAFYHQQLEPVYKKMEDQGGYFEIFKAKENKDTEEILNLIENRQLDENKKKIE